MVEQNIKLAEQEINDPEFRVLSIIRLASYDYRVKTTYKRFNPSFIISEDASKEGIKLKFNRQLTILRSCS